MEQQTTIQPSSSSQMWEWLEAFVREQVQRFIQALLEEEVTAETITKWGLPAVMLAGHGRQSW